MTLRNIHFYTLVALLSFFPLTGKPLLIVTQPKSGTTYIRETLTRYFGGVVPYREFPLNGPSLEQYQALLKKYCDRDIPASRHYFFSNVAIIEEAKKAGCHVAFVPRDPRSAIVSWAIYKHIFHEKIHVGHGRALTTAEKQLVKDHLKATFQKNFSKRLRVLKRWKRWKEAYPQTITICTFEELKRDRIAFFIKLLTPFGYDQNRLDLNKFTPPQIGHARYRNSKRDEWKEYLDDEMLAYANNYLSKGLFDFYGWTP